MNASNKITFNKKSYSTVEVYKGRKQLQEEAEREREQAEKDRIQKVKDDFEKEHDSLEYMRDKDMITEDEYYRQLAALNDKYYKGKTEFLDEYQKYELEVYEYLKKKEEERLDELKEKTEAQYENTKDYIVDMIDEQIAAEEKKLDELDKEQEEQEKLKEIEEARQKLAEAQNKKVRVYRAGVGFVYETNQSAVEEAQKELDEILKEQEKEKKEQEIQDEIDRLEDLKDAWEDSLDIEDEADKYGMLMEWITKFEEASYEERLELAKEFGDSYKKILDEIAKQQENIANTAKDQLPGFGSSGNFASGTDYVDKPGLYTVGEAGRETVFLPRGAAVANASDTRGIDSFLDSGISSILSSLSSYFPKFSFGENASSPIFDFSNWEVGIEYDTGLRDAIQANLRETVIQYIAKRGK